MTTMMFRHPGPLLMLGTVVLLLPGCGGKPSPAGKSSLSYVDQVAAAQKESIPEVRAKKLIRIGYQQAKAEDELGAEETFDLAAKACREVEDPLARVGSLVLLAQAQLKLGNSTPARKALDSAWEAADRIEAPESKARTLAGLAPVQDALGDRPGAIATLESAEQLAAELTDAAGNPDAFGQMLVLGAVAEGYHNIDEAADADRMIAAALGLAPSVDDELRRCEALAGLALTQHETTGKTGAEQTFAAALAIARSMQSPYKKAHALADVAEKLSRCGFHARTHEVLDEADLVADKIPEPDLKQQTVQKVRSLMGKLPKPKGEK